MFAMRQSVERSLEMHGNVSNDYLRIYETQ